MYGADIAGANLDRFYLSRFAHSRGEDEIPEDVRAVRGHRERFIRRDDEIWRTKLPARREDGRRRRVRGRALGSAGPHPLFDGFDLRVREPALAGKFAEARGRQPGRHIAFPGHSSNLLRMLSGVFVSQKREWPRLSGT